MTTTPKKRVPAGRVHTAKTRKDGATDVNVPKTKPGNNAHDQKWVAAHSLELKPVDDTDEVPYGVRLQWDGKAENIGSEFFTPTNAENRCTGLAYIRDGEGRHIIDKDGLTLVRPCLGWRIPGLTVCVKHGGGPQHVLAAAKRRLLAAVDPAIGHLINIAVRDGVDPEVRLRAIVQILDRVGIRGGVEVSVETPEWQAMLRDLFGGSGSPTPPVQAEVAPAVAAAPTKRAPRRPTR